MLSEYELQRQARIAANKARMELLGVQEAASKLNPVSAPRRVRSAASNSQKPTQRARPETTRRSARVAGNPAVTYNENELARLGLAEEQGPKSKHDRRTLTVNVKEEIYGVEHVQALGTRTKEWTLFQDGYNSNGERIYDKVSGKTCHQCRQKTVCMHTSCSSCESLQGVFCGDCLWMRYGEHIEEANANPDWKCPNCRDLCNCSFHRTRRGWAPTGSMYRTALAEGYASVAHYLVLNNVAPEAREEALPLMPADLAAKTRKDLLFEVEAHGKAQASVSTRLAVETNAKTSSSTALVDAQVELQPANETDAAASTEADAAKRKSGRQSVRARRQTLLSQVGMGAVKKVRAAATSIKPAVGKAIAAAVAAMGVEKTVEAPAVRLTRSRRAAAVSVAA